MLKPFQIKKSLNDCIKQMSIDRERFIKDPDKNFVRNTKCNISVTANLILCFENQCLNSELIEHFWKKPEKAVRPSTLVMQREKFADNAFKNLFNDFNACFPFQKKYKKSKLHLVACDGSDINLPTQATDDTYFVENKDKNGRGYYQAHLNAFYDLCENRYLDIEIQPRPKMDERRAFINMLNRTNLKEKTLFIADRGYFSWNLAANIVFRDQFFLFRAKNLESSRSTFKYMTIPSTDEFDIEKSLKLVRSMKKEYREMPDKYKCLHASQTFDFISPGNHIDEFPIDFRIVRVNLGDDKYEYLLTNLPKESYPLKELKKLYAMRWGEETSFKHLKYTCALNWFHSVKRKFIIQEIYARVIMYNFTSLMLQTVDTQKVRKKEKEQGKTRKHDFTLAFSNAAKIARLYLRDQISDKKIKALLLERKIPKREKRKAPRNIAPQRNKPLNSRV